MTDDGNDLKVWLEAGNARKPSFGERENRSRVIPCDLHSFSTKIDENLISPYNVNTQLRRMEMRIQEIINNGILC